MTGPLSVVAAIDRLYEGVVSDPEAWTDTALADWAEEVAAAGLDREQARAVRRCMRMAQRLRDFWLDAADESVTGDWRSRVDMAAGPKAWRPTLELAMAGLETEPSPELFALAAERFRVVNNEPWLDGIGYEEWMGKG